MRTRVDYERHGRTYSRHRRADPRIAARIHAALGDAGTVLNVGAGAGSYEPSDRRVLAVEPSATMRAQRPAGAAPAIDARAEALPFDDDTFDAAMACVTIHHWESPEVGLAELRRVARGPVVVFTFELDYLPAWQLEHLREGVAKERPRFPAIDDIEAALGGRTRVEQIPTPGDCTDGFFEAFWRRPEVLLEPEVRGAQSVWALLEPGVEQRIVERLTRALDTGAWDAEHGHLREQESFPGSLRLVISEGGRSQRQPNRKAPKMGDRSPTAVHDTPPSNPSANPSSPDPPLADPDLRHATAQDIPHLQAMLAEAFFDDPVFGWLMPVDIKRRARLRRYFGIDLGHLTLPRGRVWTTSDLTGAALSLPPGKWRVPPHVSVLQGSTFGVQIARAARLGAAMEWRHMRLMRGVGGTHYYVRDIGVHPQEQGKGLGGALMRPTLDRCDREGLPAYIEASSERSAALYERLGFEHIEKLRVGGSPPLWLMLRQPHPRG